MKSLIWLWTYLECLFKLLIFLLKKMRSGKKVLNKQVCFIWNLILFNKCIVCAIKFYADKVLLYYWFSSFKSISFLWWNVSKREYAISNCSWLNRDIYKSKNKTFTSNYEELNRQNKMTNSTNFCFLATLPVFNVGLSK